MKYLLTFFTAVALTIVFTYYFQFHNLPASLKEHGYLNFLMIAPNGTFGALIGAIAASHFSITPAIMKIPKKLSELRKNSTLSNPPSKATGKVIGKVATKNNIELRVQYNENEKIFDIDKRVFQDPISTGDNVIVYYDPYNPALAYLDLYAATEEAVSLVNNSDTLFKLIEITPRFDINLNTFELIGEIHGGEFQGKKASIIHGLPREEIHLYAPGRLFPCNISGTKSDYSIQLLVG